MLLPYASTPWSAHRGERRRCRSLSATWTCNRQHSIMNCIESHRSNSRWSTLDAIFCSYTVLSWCLHVVSWLHYGRSVLMPASWCSQIHIPISKSFSKRSTMDCLVPSQLIIGGKANRTLMQLWGLCAWSFYLVFSRFNYVRFVRLSTTTHALDQMDVPLKGSICQVPGWCCAWFVFQFSISWKISYPFHQHSSLIRIGRNITWNIFDSLLFMLIKHRRLIKYHSIRYFLTHLFT